MFWSAVCGLTSIDEIRVIHRADLALKRGLAELVLLVGILSSACPDALQPFLRYDIADLKILQRFSGQGQDLVHLVVQTGYVCSRCVGYAGSC